MREHEEDAGGGGRQNRARIDAKKVEKKAEREREREREGEKKKSSRNSRPIQHPPAGTERYSGAF